MASKKQSPTRVYAREDCYIHEKWWPAGSTFLYYGAPSDIEAPGSPIIAADSQEAMQAAQMLEQGQKAEALPWVHGTGQKVGVHPMLADQ